jgi:hypothetical protein
MLPRKVRSACCRGCAPQPSPPARRGWELAAGAFSLGIWAFMPKCPLCLAAYVALWTGLGLSLAAATYLRWALLLVSVSFGALVPARDRQVVTSGL